MTSDLFCAVDQVLFRALLRTRVHRHRRTAHNRHSRTQTFRGEKPGGYARCGQSPQVGAYCSGERSGTTRRCRDYYGVVVRVHGAFSSIPIVARSMVVVRVGQGLRML
jgi:hypothetical protein